MCEPEARREAQKQVVIILITPFRGNGPLQGYRDADFSHPIIHVRNNTYSWPKPLLCKSHVEGICQIIYFPNCCAVLRPRIPFEHDTFPPSTPIAVCMQKSSMYVGNEGTLLALRTWSISEEMYEYESQGAVNPNRPVVI